MTHTEQAAFPVRGVTESFYGVYYTFEQRSELIRFLGKHGYNQYIYGPKNDRQHRMRWQEPYPDYIMAQFAGNVQAAREAGVTFVYSIGSGVSMSYSSAEDFRIVTEKFKAFYDIGVRDFSILLDDISSEFKHQEDAAAYASFAEAHADVCNRLLGWLRELDPACTLSMCPTDYHGPAPFGPYIRELGEKLHADVDIYYTGPDICSRAIGRADTEAFAEAAGRKPVIWDNYPVNDLAMRHELHIGPIRGRDAALAETTKGFIVNPMAECEASKIALLTFEDYFRDPAGYDPEASWDRAVRAIAGERSEEAFRLFAAQVTASCLGEPEGEELAGLTDAAMAALEAGEPAAHADVQRLSAYLTELDEACYHLKNRMANTALRNDLLPWIEVLEHWHWMAKRAFLVIEAAGSGEPFDHPLNMMKESMELIDRAPKRMAGEPLRRLYALALAKADAAAVPSA